MAFQEQAKREQIQSIRFEWNIDKFSELAVNDEVMTSKFTFWPNCVINLTISKTLDYDFNVWIDLRRKTKTDSFIHSEISIIDRYGKKRLTERKRLNLFMSRSFEKIAEDLNIEKEREDLLPGDTLTIRCILSLEDNSNVLDENTQTDEILLKDTTSIKFLSTLSSDLQKFYENKTDTDFILKIGEVQFPVHRAVLAARSEVFAAMFHHDTSDSTSGEVNIQDVQAEALSSVLLYVYSGKICGLTAETAVSIFIAADKYAFLELREHCLDFLLHNLTISNISDAAVLSHSHGEETLENEIGTFINDNTIEVTSSKEWQDFFAAKPLIAGKLLQTALLKKHAKYCMEN